MVAYTLLAVRLVTSRHTSISFSMSLLFIMPFVVLTCIITMVHTVQATPSVSIIGPVLVRLRYYITVVSAVWIRMRLVVEAIRISLVYN